MLTVDPAWPGGDPWLFALTVLIGAFGALVTAHVIPAICQPVFGWLWDSSLGRLLLIPLAIWLSVGAATSLIETAAVTGSMLVLWRDLPVGDAPNPWRTLARFVAGLYVLASIAYASVPQWRDRAATACLCVGAGLAVAACMMHYPALNASNPHMQSEAGLGAEPSRVASGMLLASGPIAILAVRIGGMRLSFRQILLTGFWGVWLPLVTSVALVSVAKVLGVRLYWKPSLPLDWPWAFVWLSGSADQSMAFVWPLLITFAPTSIVLATWMTDITGTLRLNWQRNASLAGILAVGYYLHSPVLWNAASRSWLWSILAASAVLGALRLWMWLRTGGPAGPSPSDCGARE